MKTYTITGATGYIGSQLIKHLTNNGDFVNAIVRQDKHYPHLEHKNIKVFLYEEECDLEQPIENSDYIIHLGALYTTQEDARATIDLINSNILFSTQIFNVAKRTNPNAVIASASTFSSLDGHGNYSPSTLYAATKSAVETIAKYYRELSIHFLTFPDTYGPGDWRPKIHNILAKNKEWPFQFRSSGKQEMRMLHVEDIIGHLLTSLENEEKGVHIHDIYAEGILVNLKELSEAITERECLFDESSVIVEIPKKERDGSTLTGYKNKHSKLRFL